MPTASCLPLSPTATPDSRPVVERFGRLDILVNNAGLMLLGPIVGANPKEWERMIAINQKGLLYMTNAALPHLLTARELPGRRLRRDQRSKRKSLQQNEIGNGGPTHSKFELA